MPEINYVSQAEVRKVTIVHDSGEQDFMELRFQSRAGPDEPLTKTPWLRLSMDGLSTLRKAIETSLATPTRAMPDGWLND